MVHWTTVLGNWWLCFADVARTSVFLFKLYNLYWTYCEKWAKSNRSKLVANDCSHGAHLFSSDFSSPSVDKTYQHMSANVPMLERASWQSLLTRCEKGRQVGVKSHKASRWENQRFISSGRWVPKVFLWMRHGHSEVGYQRTRQRWFASNAGHHVYTM